MSFFAVLLALICEQLKPLPHGNAVHAAVAGWAQWCGRHFDAGEKVHARVVWGVTVLLPALLVLRSTGCCASTRCCWPWASMC